MSHQVGADEDDATEGVDVGVIVSFYLHLISLCKIYLV